MSVLRVYVPAECDAAGVPLDWDRCDDCEGNGKQIIPGHLLAGQAQHRVCPRCEGHGSLKAAVLHRLRLFAAQRAYDDDPERPDGAPIFARLRTEWMMRLADEVVVRCEDCGHPMSEGTWDEARVPDVETAQTWFTNVRDMLEDGIAPRSEGSHWSACDEGCRHGAPFRTLKNGEPFHNITASFPGGAAHWVSLGAIVEASWRQVDVRCLSWAHDLRPEQLAVLCLRCWAAR